MGINSPKLFVHGNRASVQCNNGLSSSMQKRAKQLNVIQDNGTNSPVVTGTTCFSVQAKQGVDCQRTHCKHWITNPESHNCVIIASQEGPHTLQKIGKIYGLTRMRICQIEKAIFEKIKQVS